MFGAGTCVEKNQDDKNCVLFLVWLTGIKDE